MNMRQWAIWWSYAPKISKFYCQLAWHSTRRAWFRWCMRRNERLVERLEAQIECVSLEEYRQRKQRREDWIEKSRP